MLALPPATGYRDGDTYSLGEPLAIRGIWLWSRQRVIQRARVHEEFERRQREEQQRVDKLLADTSGWHQSGIIREYVDVVRQQALGNEGSEEGGELERWIAWALEQADRLDPLKPSPPSELNEESLE